jgi:Lon protease-like protein
VKQALPIFPLGTTYLPGDVVQLHIFEDRYIQMCTDLESVDTGFVSVLIERGHEVGGSDVRCSYGVAVSIHDMFRADGRILLTGHATHAVEISHWLSDDPYPRAFCQPLDFQIPSDTSTDDVVNSLKSLLSRVEFAEAIALNDEISDINTHASVPHVIVSYLFWAISRLIPSGPQDRYLLLQTQDLTERLCLLDEMITHFREISQFQGG